MIFDLINDEEPEVAKKDDFATEDADPISLPTSSFRASPTAKSNSVKGESMYNTDSPVAHVTSTTGAKDAYNYYLNKGVDKKVAAGIVGNLFVESNFNPNAVGDGGTSKGIAQWHNERLNGLRRYASKRGKAWNDRDTQLDYVLDEDPSIINSMKGAKNNAHAAQIFTDKFERPNPRYANYAKRRGMAESVAQMRYGGESPNVRKANGLSSRRSFREKVIDTASDIIDYPHKKAMTLLGGDGDEQYSDLVEKRRLDKTNLISKLDKSTTDKIGLAGDLILDPISFLPAAKIAKSLKIASKLNKARIYNGALRTANVLGHTDDANDIINFPKKMRYGGPLKRKKFGDKLNGDAIGAGLNTAGQLVSSFDTNENYSDTGLSTVSGALSGAGTGAGIGSAFGPLGTVVGGGIGAIVGAFSGNAKAKKERELYEKKQQLASDTFKNYMIAKSRGTLGNYPTQGVNVAQYRYGGRFARMESGGDPNDPPARPDTRRKLEFDTYDQKWRYSNPTYRDSVKVYNRGVKLREQYIDLHTQPQSQQNDEDKVNFHYLADAIGETSLIKPETTSFTPMYGKPRRRLRNILAPKPLPFDESKPFGNMRYGGRHKKFAMGGQPDYEAEHGEVIVGDNVQYTGGKQVASNLHRIEGRSHEQANPNTVNGTGEDVVGGDFVFSHSLSLDGKSSIADIAYKLAKKKAKAEAKLQSNDYIVKNTGTVQAQQIDEQLEALAQEQESMKQSIGIMRYGGIPRMANGGTKESAKRKLIADQQIMLSTGKTVRRGDLPANHPKSVDNYLKDTPVTASDEERAQATLTRKESRRNAILTRLKSNSDSAIAERRAKESLVKLNKNGINTDVGKVVKSSLLDIPKPQKPIVVQQKPVVPLNNDQKYRDRIKREEAADVQKDVARERAERIRTSKDGVARTAGRLGLTTSDKITLGDNLKYGLEEPATAKPKRFSMSARTTMEPDKTRVAKPEKPFIAGKPKEEIKTVAQSNAGSNRPDIYETAPTKKASAPAPEKTRYRNRTARTSQPAASATKPVVAPVAKPIAIPNIARPTLPSVAINPVKSDSTATTNFNKTVGRDIPKNGINAEDATNLAMIGTGYLANRNAINKMKTDVPANLMQQQTYGYFDQSQGARNAVNSQVGSARFNPYATRTQQMGAFAKGVDTINDINQSELNRKQDYDTQYRAAGVNIDNINNQIINNSQTQQIDNENAKQAAQVENINNTLENVNGYFEGKAKKRSQLQAANLISMRLTRRGLDPQTVVPL